MALATAHIRIARPTNDMPSLVPFYRDGLCFEVLLTFSGHEGFDGVLLGHKGSGYHLEFTSNAEHDAGRAPTPDNLLVFYLPDAEQYQSAVARMQKAGFAAVTSFNPYWDRWGKTFEDADGYRTVLANMKAPVA
ncbi:Prolyl endopeptidase [Coniochaeta hoffmannii]|uniref:Prolyl endopeptidase n=1 Tax=Coniochaeta hoffmannii TaxID=91930 RepID=A0AA38RFL8_9PEZI|nr:Prolyl endopeptidase [Coniochaeta hoffmannii]